MQKPLRCFWNSLPAFFPYLFCSLKLAFPWPLSLVLSSALVSFVTSTCICSLAFLPICPDLYIPLTGRHHHMNVVLSIFVLTCPKPNS